MTLSSRRVRIAADSVCDLPVEMASRLGEQDGEITSLARLRTSKRAVERFLESIDDIAPSDTLVIEISPTLGCHVGPGSVGVATLRSDWRR